MANQTSVKKLVASIVMACALVVIFVTPAKVNGQSSQNSTAQETKEVVN